MVQRQRLRQCGHLLRKDKNDWMKTCIDYKVEEVDKRKPGVRLWRKTVGPVLACPVVPDKEPLNLKGLLLHPID